MMKFASSPGTLWTLALFWVMISLQQQQVLALHNPIEATSNPPLLDIPTYSLATLNKDGSTNMNILTYATPVSMRPERVWSLGLYKETLSSENVLRTPTPCVLQVLTQAQATLVTVLGGNSGRDIDKRAECAKLGFEWRDLDNEEQKAGGGSAGSSSGIQVLPGCAHYLKLSIQGGLIDAGSHLIVPYCQVDAMYYIPCGLEESACSHLSTSILREVGIITPEGRVADIKREENNLGFRLE